MINVILFFLSFNSFFFLHSSNAEPIALSQKSIIANHLLNLSKDSSIIYYEMGWSAYKLKKFGVARYYWDLGSNYNTNIAAKYSCAFRLGLLHQTGQGVGKNLELAFNFYNLAYANGESVGNVDATKNIAAYYENGIYVPKDLDKALEWYEKAKAQGNKYCDNDILRLKKVLSKN